MLSARAAKYLSSTNYSLAPCLPAVSINASKTQDHLKWKCTSRHCSVFTQLRNVDRNYASIKDNFKIKVPEYLNFANDFIDQWAEVDKGESDKPLAFWFVYTNGNEEKWTYEELTQKTKKAANALKSLGAGTKWKRCLVILPKMPEWWLINVACMRLGVILVPTTSQATPKDIEYRLKLSKAECIFTVSKFADAVDSLQPKCPVLSTKILVNPEGNRRSGWGNFKLHYDNASDQHQYVPTKSSDVLQVFFTSGTTSLPKKVVQSNKLPLGLFTIFKYTLPLDRRVVFWSLADTGWAKTLWSCLLTPWTIGATAFVHQMPVFEPQLTLDVLRDYPVNCFCAPPTAYRLLVANEMPKFMSLRACLSGGEPLNPEISKNWKAQTGITIREAFGQTETVGLIATIPGEPAKPGSMGTRVAGMPVDIVDDSGKVLPIGQKGNIGVKIKPEKPLGIFIEYEDDPVKTAKCIAGDYYLTGDRAHEDEDGFFWYDCRSDDVITSAAYRIGPFEVESALQEHPDVLESGVVGVPDTERTQAVKAFVVLKESGKKKNPDELIKELQNHVKQTTAPYKYPRQIEFVDSLPKTPSGKVKRAALRDRST